VAAGLGFAATRAVEQDVTSPEIGEANEPRRRGSRNKKYIS